MQLGSPAVLKHVPAEKLAALQAKVDKLRLLEERASYEGSLSAFVRAA